MKKEEKNSEIKIDNLIALINILDNYEDFSNNLKKFVKKEKYNRELIGKLHKISKDEFCIRDMGAKKFYKDNKEVIDIINKYTSIYDFICSNYDYNGNLIDGYDKLDYYYNYILKNKNNIEQIKLVLDRIKDLGINKINYNESYNFTNNTYHFSLNHKGCLNYLDNIEVLPGYSKSKIDYYTKESNYKIMIYNFDDIYETNEIYLNSLIFNPNVLPKKISKEETLDIIFNLKKKNNEEENKIREVIELSVAVDNLESQYAITNSIINKLDTIKNKKELKMILIEMLYSISKIREIENNQYQDLISNSNKITKKRLIKEKRNYLEQKKWEK